MIGLYCTFGWREGAVRPVLETPMGTRAHVRGAPGLHATAIVPQFRLGHSVADEEDDWLLIDGFVYDDHDVWLDASAVLSRLRERGPGAVEELNGEFAIVAHVGGGSWLLTDRMGTRQHVIARHAGVAAVAPQPRAALAAAGLTPSLDERALAAFLFTNKVRRHRDTMWQGGKVLPPATRLSWDGASLREDRYWRLRYQPDNDHDPQTYVPSLVHIYRSATERCAVPGEVRGATLTGGLDSRTMVAALPASARSALRAITMGMAGSDEVEIAASVAQRLQMDHRPTIIQGGDVFDAGAWAFLENEDCDLLIQGLWAKFLAQNADLDVVMHGLDLDVTIGGIYLTPELGAVQDWDGLVDYALAHVLSLSPIQLEKLFRPEVVELLGENVRAFVGSMLEPCREDDLLNTYDHFIMRCSMERVILQRYRAIRQVTETISPMYDRRLIELYLTVPASVRMNYTLFHPFLMQLCPDVADITYQRTALPAAAPVWSWPESQRLEASREALYRRIARATNGAVHIPYRRHYTNVDEWLRFDPLWRGAVKVLLQSSASIVATRWVNREYLDAIIQEHMAHEVSHLKALMLLLSAEVILRRESGWSNADMLGAIWEAAGVQREPADY